MAHLFFARPDYPWQHPLAQKLHHDLVAVYTTVPAIQDLASKADVVNIAWGQSAYHLWREVLIAAAAADCLHALLKLVVADKTVRAIHDTVQQAIEATRPAEALDAELVLLRRPLLDRKRLRAALLQMQERGSIATAPPVLLVQGEPKSGKTRTKDLVTLIAERNQDRLIYLQPNIAPTLNEVVMHLLRKITNASPPPRSSSLDAWFREVCLDLFMGAHKAKQRWWIVVDDLSRLDPEITAFFHTFAAALDDPECMTYFRLVLIDYPRLPNHPPRALRDLCQIDQTTQFNAEDVAEMVGRVWLNKNKLFGEQEVREQAQALLASSQRYAEAQQLSHAQAVYEQLVDWMTRP